MLTMIGAINEFERTNMLERQLEGIRIAKDKGNFKKKDINMDKLADLKKDVDNGLISVTTAAKELGITRMTWYTKVKNL